MGVIVGSGDYTYRVEEGWGKLPPGYKFGDVAAVGTDRKDNVYVFNRSQHPMIVFDREGNFLRSWGEGIFPRPHGVHMGPDDTIYLTDDGDHSVKQCTLDGKVLLTLGIPGKPAERFSGKPFNRCTHTALSPQNDIYVSDGYGNALRPQVRSGGQLLFSWGESGYRSRTVQHCPQYQPAMPTAGSMSPTAKTIACRCSTARANTKRSGTICTARAGSIMTPGKCPICYIGEIGPHLPVNRESPNLGPRVSIVDHKGKLLARLARVPSLGQGPGQFISPHGLCVDSRGDLYVGEVAYTSFKSSHPRHPQPEYLRAMQKFTKVPAGTTS